MIIMVMLLTANAFFVQTSSAQNAGTISLNNVFTEYINLKNTLVADKGDDARIAAKDLYKAINDVPMEKLSADQHKTWMQYSEKISYDAEHIKGTNEIDHQREHFISLSSNMYKLMKSLKINSADIYYQYCPMANSGKGAFWVSEKEKVSNPYMGKKMPTCGSTKETLKGNN